MDHKESFSSHISNLDH